MTPTLTIKTAEKETYTFKLKEFHQWNDELTFTLLTVGGRRTLTKLCKQIGEVDFVLTHDHEDFVFKGIGQLKDCRTSYVKQKFNVSANLHIMVEE